MVPFIRLGSRVFHTTAMPLSPRVFLHAVRTEPLALTRQVWLWEWHALVLWAAVSVVAVVLLGVSVATTVPTSAGSSNALLKIATIDGIKVLTNDQRLTLYWFVPDTPHSSNCSGSCVAYWPPVTGSPSAGPGVTGRLGTIKRSDGSKQVTYDGHPLYTYISDTAPGQANGNGLDVNGGIWHEMRASG